MTVRRDATGGPLERRDVKNVHDADGVGSLSRVAAPWGRIVSWLSDNATDDFDSLRPPASPEDLTALDPPGGVHPDVRALLEVNDGSDGAGLEVVPRFHLLRARQMRRRIFEPVGYSDLSQAPWPGRFWLPFAMTTTGEMLVVDHTAGREHGLVRLVDYEGGIWGRPCCGSLFELLVAVADSLESELALSITVRSGSYIPVPGGRLFWQEERDPQ